MKTPTSIVRLAALVVAAALAFAPPARAGGCSASCSAGNCTLDGIMNVPLGSGSLSIDASCHLLVSGIGPSGTDGVVQNGLGSVYMVTTLVTPNFSGSILGTEADIRQVGTAGGVAGRELSLTKIQNVNGTTVRLEMDCAAIMVAAYATEIYDASGLVYAQAPTGDNPVLLFPRGDMEAMACALLPDGDLYTTVRFGGAIPITIQTTSGNLGPFTGTCVKMRGYSPAVVPTLQEAIENRFRNTGDVAIASLFAGALPGTDMVCPMAPVPVRGSTWGSIKVLYR